MKSGRGEIEDDIEHGRLGGEGSATMLGIGKGRYLRRNGGGIFLTLEPPNNGTFELLINFVVT